MTRPRGPAADALRLAADRAMRAPSVANSQPWRLALFRDRLEVLLDRSRQALPRDPVGRELVLSAGAALFNARVGVAGSHLVDAVRRFPDPARPELAAVLRAEPGVPDRRLTALAPAVDLRHSNRRP
ncbi:hypothetical protein [Modestobacter sp. NPDC049651]|uniref:hypothetical protein n=1 Tax=unclassified Modestobacter TaxID=2643866 RepID=UPI00340D38A6